MSDLQNQGHEKGHYRDLNLPHDWRDLEGSIKKAEEIEKSLTLELGNASLTPQARKRLHECRESAKVARKMALLLLKVAG